MIKIRIDETKLAEIVLEHKKLLESPYSLKQTLVTLKEKYESTSTNRYNFFVAMEQNVEELLVGKPDKLQALQKLIHPLYQKVIEEDAGSLNEEQLKNFKKQFRNEVYSIFDYAQFSANYDGYGAYQLTTSLDVNVCPYCNHQSIFTIRTENGKTRARLDHWYNRASHPYFSLSLFNLIPSCQTCNSDLKNTKKFSLDKFIHPYHDGFEKEFKFKTGILRANYSSGNLDSFNISLVPDKDIVAEIQTKGNNSKVIFLLENIYNMEKKRAGLIIEESFSYSRDYIEDEILKKGIYSSVTEVIEKVFKFTSKIEDFGKETLSKFTHDIAEEQGLHFEA